MKMYYTQDELKKLSPEEILEITSFEGGGLTYFYEDLIKLSSDGDEFSISFKDGSDVYTKDKVVFNSIKVKKARYDLLRTSLKEFKLEEDRRDEFRESIKDEINEAVSKIHYDTKINRINFDNSLRDLQKKSEDMIKKIDSTLTNLEDNWDKKLEKLNDFNKEEYNLKMEKIQKIADAFSELLED